MRKASWMGLAGLLLILVSIRLGMIRALSFFAFMVLFIGFCLIGLWARAARGEEQEQGDVVE